MFPFPSFNYCVIHAAREPRVTQFQGFDYAWLLSFDQVAQILQLPSSAGDLKGGPQGRIRLRCLGLGRYHIAVTTPDAIDRLSGPLPYMVLVTAAETDGWGRAYATRQSEPVLHLPHLPIGSEVGFSAVSWDTIRVWSDRVLGYIATIDARAAEALNNYPGQGSDADIHESLPVAGHVLTLPNDLALLSVHHPAHESDDGAKAEIDADTASMVAWQNVASLREQHFRDSEYPPGTTALLLSSAGMARDLPSVLSRDARTQVGSEVAAAFKWIRGSRALDAIPAVILDRFQKSSDAWSLLNERNGELRTHVLAVAVEACSQFVPSVMLQSGFDAPRGLIGSLGDVLRSRPHGWRTRSAALAKQIGTRLAASVPDYALSYLARRQGTLKAITDEPVELMQFQGRPVSMVRPVVRVPATPGFVLVQGVSNTPWMLPPKDFDRILVLRGTDARDPIHGFIDEFHRKNSRSRIEIHAVDVRNLRDVDNALKTFDGAMMVFDAHGIHPTRRPGVIRLGESEVSLAGLRAPLPPIVFLAACDTHAIDRRQDTVAAALLSAGARTVIGTMVPVGAIETTWLCVDVISRIGRWVPQMPGPIRWSELFAACMWHSHSIEAAMALMERKTIRLSLKGLGEFADTMDRVLATFDPQWFEKACLQLSGLSSMSPEAIRTAWLDRAYLTNATLFCQLGQADSLFLLPSNDWQDGRPSPTPFR